MSSTRSSLSRQRNNLTGFTLIPVNKSVFSVPAECNIGRCVQREGTIPCGVQGITVVSDEYHLKTLIYLRRWKEKPLFFLRTKWGYYNWKARCNLDCSSLSRLLEISIGYTDEKGVRNSEYLPVAEQITC